jgi:hypothetical protein
MIMVYSMKITISADHRQWLKNMIGIRKDIVSEYVSKLIADDIEKWNKISVEVCEPIIKQEKEMGLL